MEEGGALGGVCTRTVREVGRLGRSRRARDSGGVGHTPAPGVGGNGRGCQDRAGAIWTHLQRMEMPHVGPSGPGSGVAHPPTIGQKEGAGAEGGALLTGGARWVLGP